MGESDDERLSLLVRKIERLERVMDHNARACEKMSRHIDFVERVYQGLRAPLAMLARAFNAPFGTPTLMGVAPMGIAPMVPALSYESAPSEDEVHEVQPAARR